MKKTVALILALVFALCALAGCASNPSDASSADASNSEKFKFILGFDQEFPPYGYIADDGSYTGFDLDLARELCTRRGWELVLNPIDWEAKDKLLGSGQINCIWNGFTITDREDDYTWTVPYVDNSQVIVVKKDSGITKLADLAGKVVAVQQASSALTALNSEKNTALKASFGKIEERPDYNVAFMELEMGTVDAIALDIGVAKFNIASRGADKYEMLDENNYIATEQYAIGFKKGNTELRDQVQETLLEMAADGKFMEIAQKYSDFGLTDSVCIGKDVK